MITNLRIENKIIVFRLTYTHDKYGLQVDSSNVVRKSVAFAALEDIASQNIREVLSDKRFPWTWKKWTLKKDQFFVLKTALNFLGIQKNLHNSNKN